MKRRFLIQSFVICSLLFNKLLSAQSNCFSLRFNDNDQAKLTKTFASAPSSKRAQTYSFWVKRGTLTDGVIFSGSDGVSTNVCMIAFFSDQLYMQFGTGNFPPSAIYKTKELFRDPSAWYHIVVAINVDEPVGADRLKTWINGKQVTDWFSGTSLTTNDIQMLLNNQYNVIGAHPSFTYPFDGYLYDFYAIDGQTLTAASFGQINSISGEWEPMPYSGTYGNNGFHLNFADNAPATDTGKDISGNNHHWNLNNIDATDQMLDVPTNNFCTLLPINTCSFNELSDGNLNIQGSGSGQGAAGASFGVSAGKWYWEATLKSGNPLVADYGVLRADVDMCSISPATSPVNSLLYYRGDGSKQNAGTNSPYASTFGSNDVIGIALDMDAGTIAYYKNGVSQGVAFTGLTGTYFPAVFDYGMTVDAVSYLNFGQGGLPCQTYYVAAGGYFSYPPPSGYKTLCANNITTPVIIKGADHFASLVYTGNGAVHSLATLSFQPDIVFVKDRTSTNDWGCFDGARGATKVVSSNTSGAETVDAASLTSFNSNGFTVNSSAPVNTAANEYASYNWKTDNTTGGLNSNGSINANVSLNATAGISLITYSGTGSNATVGHGLGNVPEFMMIKKRNGNGNWAVYHNKMNASPETGQMQLNSTGPFISDNTVWNATVPSNSVFSIGTNPDVNASGDTYVAYLFSDVEGFSRTGVYTGNGDNDGPFVWCGFEPAFVMVKKVNGTDNWLIFDNQRPGYNNGAIGRIYPSGNHVEATRDVDLLVNGFKLRNTDPDENSAGDIYIFLAFAKVPFKYASGAANLNVCALPEPPHEQLTACDSAQINGNWYSSSQTVTDTLQSSLGCDSIVITDLTIVLPLNPITIISQTNVSCNSLSDGSATISVSGGTLPYSYDWVPLGGTGATASGLSAGTYTVSVTDSSRCDTVFKIVTITEPAVLLVDSAVSDVSCFGGNNGTATAFANGGTAPYLYSWSSGGTSAIENNLPAGTYTITVTDSNSCIASDTVIVSEAPPLTVDVISSVDVTCSGGIDGSATAGASGGVVPYVYLWSSGSTSINTGSLSSGSYTITVTDSNSCVSVDSVVIQQPLPISITMSSSPTVCTGNTGIATAVPAGGTTPYTYVWSSGGMLSVEDSLTAGTYIVTVSDSNSCIKTDSITITSVDSIISVTFTTLSAICTSASGAATVVASGGTSPYTYSWSTGGTAVMEDSLATGIYTVMVTDVNGCVQNGQTDITSVNLLTVNVTSTASSCDTATGTATAVAANGTPPYVYSWNSTPAQTTATATGLVSGNYMVTVSDSNGCSQNQTVSVAQLSGPTAVLAASATNINAGDNSQLVAVGGVSYTWTPVTGLSCINCQNPLAMPQETTTYCVTVSDTSNCTDSACVTIVVETPCGKLEVPTAFSPNGDGRNDLFVLQGMSNCFTSFSFMIFDRWGEKVFETENFYVSWNGTYKGKILDPAVFVYYISATFTNGEKIEKKGNISLLR